jgi:hypothetical protein
MNISKKLQLKLSRKQTNLARVIQVEKMKKQVITANKIKKEYKD